MARLRPLQPPRQVMCLVLVGVTLAGCSGTGGGAASNARTPLTVGLGYVPSVQFAQFYYADQAGYYRDAGLDVTFRNTIDPDLITLLGQGAVDVGMADGTSLIPAVSHGIPVRYAATIYGKFPSVVFAKASSGIRSAADLRGKRLGIPGKYGSSWIMLQALLHSVGMTVDDVTVETFPDFSQASAVERGAVDAATGFVNNEPVQLRLKGEDVVVLSVDDVTPLPGPGLSVGTGTLTNKRAALRAFVAATVRAMDEISADPDKGLDAALKRVPELASDREGQRAILMATIDAWAVRGGAARGAIDRPGWSASLEFMRTLPGVVEGPLTVDQLVTEELLHG